MRSLAILPLLLSAQGAVALPVQDQIQYEAAIRNSSTSPSYVLVTVADDNNGQSRTGCTEANFVQGALYREMKLPREVASFERAKQIMLGSQDHVFHFSDPEALANVTFRYTPEELERARAFVQAHRDEIASHTLDRGSFPDRMQWSDALACALVEEGYQVKNADISGQIVWSR